MGITHGFAFVSEFHISIVEMEIKTKGIWYTFSDAPVFNVNYWGIKILQLNFSAVYDWWGGLVSVVFKKMEDFYIQVIFFDVLLSL